MKNDTPPPFTALNKRDVTTLLSMFAPLAFIVAIGLCFHGFVWNAVASNPAINMGIIGAATFGVVLILTRLLAAQEDFRIIARFGYEAKQGVYMKTLLEQPWLKNRYVRHYLSHIANTGGTLSTQLEHSAIESELHALQADYDSRMELPQFLVGFMIAMGLLGTFIGLLTTLTGIAGMLDHMSGSGDDVQKQFMELVVELRKPLNGMGIAFSASMFGLITSLMLAIMMTNLRRYISRVMSLARNVMHELTEMSREGKSSSGGASLSPADIDTLLSATEQAGELARTNNASSQDLVPETDFGGGQGRQEMFSGNFASGIDPALAGRFDLLTKKMEMLLDSFELNTDATRKLNDLIGFGPRMKETSEKQLEELKFISSRYEDQQKLIHNLTERINDAREVAISSSRHLSEIKENFTKMGKSTGMVEMIATSMGGQTALLEALIEETRRSQQGLAVINRTILEKKFNS